MPNPINSTPFPVQGQPWNTSRMMVSSSTGQRITAGLAGIVGQVSLNDGNFTNLATTPTEAPAGSGTLTIDLAGAETNAAKVVILLQATGALDREITIAPMNLSTAVTGAWDEQTPIRFEQIVMDIMDRAISENSVYGGEETTYNRQGIQKFQATYTESSTGAVRSKML